VGLVARRQPQPPPKERLRFPLSRHSSRGREHSQDAGKTVGQTSHVENVESKVTQTSCTYSGVSKDSLNPTEMPDVDVGLVIQITTTPNAKETFAALKPGPVSPVTGIGDEAAQDSTEPNSDPKKFSMANLHVLKNSTLIEFQVMAPTAKGGSWEALKSVAQKVADQY
jgi:hypothetical protein